ncbi:MAG: class I adenylate-forming enzyme family protein [Prochlorotrichaceae cyanobacterium]
MKRFNSDHFPQQHITDGQVEFATSRLPHLFQTLDECFLQRGLSPAQPLIFECANSTQNAIVLLYLFDRGYSFLLLPPATPDFDLTTLPTFFPSILRVQDLPLAEVTDCIEVQPNPAFTTIPEALRGGDRLYMRTSGSTGTPKLVQHHHDRFFQNVEAGKARLQLTANDRVAIPVPLFHMYGLGAAFLPSILAGASVDLQKGANLLRYIQREQKFDPTVAFMTPIFCEMLLKGRKSPRPYRMTVAAGDRVRSETFDRYEAQFGCLVKLYGSTEMGIMAAASPEDTVTLRSQSVGQPLPGIHFKLENPQTDLPPDLEGLGELWCQNPTGFEGYVDRCGNPVVEAPISNAGSDWFRTKDFGQMSDTGHIAVVGRCDHSVNRDGLLVFFSDVERAIDTCNAVELSVVVAKGESARGKGLVAYCIPAKGFQPVESEIRAHCFDRLPKRAVPDTIEILKSLPLLPNGKVDRQALVRL